jgi:uncharacterized protein YndB with AHSA1/START domain
MNKELISSKILSISTDAQRVWRALTDRETIKKYFFGTDAVSDWKEGSTLIFQGEWESDHPDFNSAGIPQR